MSVHPPRHHPHASSMASSSAAMSISPSASAASAPALPPSSPELSLQSSWAALLAGLAESSEETSREETTTSATDDGTATDKHNEKNKLLIAHVLMAFAAAPVSNDGQRVLLFLRSVCEGDLDTAEEAYIERDLTTLFPYLHTFLTIISNPAAAHAQQYFFAQELSRCIDTFLLLLRRRARESRAIRCIRRDTEDILAELTEHHIAFTSSVPGGAAAFDEELSPYHAHSLAAAAAQTAAANGAAAPSPAVSSRQNEFMTIETNGWQRLDQLAACRCCHRLWQEEQAAREQRPAAAALTPALPACTCTMHGEATPCTCPFAAAFRSLVVPPPRIASHPLRSFFDLDLSLHDSRRRRPLEVRSAQQMHFVTEKVMRVYIGILEHESACEEDEGTPSSLYELGDVSVMARFGTILSYATLPDPTLRGLALQILIGQLACTRMPHTAYAPFLEFVHHLLTSRADRGSRQLGRDADAAQIDTAAAEDERIRRVIQAVMGQIPIQRMDSHATVIIQAATRCMKYTSHPPLMIALTRLCTTLLAHMPHAIFTLPQLYQSAMQQSYRVHQAVGQSFLPLPAGLDSLLAHLARQLFSAVALTDVWTDKFPRTTAARDAQPTRSLVQQEEKYSDMPRLEREGEGPAQSPAKRKKTSHLPVDAAHHADTSSPHDTLDTDSASSAVIAGVATSATAPAVASVVSALQPIFHDLLHDALPDTSDQLFRHPAQATHAHNIVAIMRLRQAARMIGAQLHSDGTLDNKPVASAPVCLRLSVHLQTWLQWLNTLASSHHQYISTGVAASTTHAPHFPSLPLLMHHLYAILEQCFAQMPNSFFDPFRVATHHLCAWPIDAEAVKRSPVITDSPTAAAASFTLSCTAASLRLLCILPVHNAASECRLMSAALESSQTAVRCTAITLLPAFVSRMTSADRRTKGKALLQQMSRMCIAQATPRSPATATAANIPAALAQSVGPLVCAIMANGAVVDVRRACTSPRRPRHSSFLPQRFSDSTLMEPATSVDSSSLTSVAPVIDFTIDRDPSRHLDEFAHASVTAESRPSSQLDIDAASPLTPDQREAHQRTMTQPTIFNQPIHAFLAPILSPLCCPHCEGVQRSLASTSATSSPSIISLRQDLLPFLALLQIAQPTAVRWHMTRSFFRMMRHIPADEFLFASPNSVPSPSGAILPASPPAARLQSPLQRSKAPRELPFSLSQMGSGKKAKAIHSLQVPTGASNSVPAAARTAAAAAASSVDSGLETTHFTDAPCPILHPLALHLLLLLFDPAHVVRQCAVEQLELLVDEEVHSLADTTATAADTAPGPFFALFANSECAQAGDGVSAADRAHRCFDYFIQCLTHIQTNSYMLATWHHLLYRPTQVTPPTSSRQRATGIEMGLTVSSAAIDPSLSSRLASLDCFSSDLLLTTFASIGQLALFTPLGSATQQLLLWPIIEAMAYATAHADTDLSTLALAYFTRLAHSNRLSTNGFFFLHSQYLFEKLFHTQIQQTPEIIKVIFERIIAQDGDEDSASLGDDDGRLACYRRSHRTTSDWSLRDFYREGVRMTVPGMILHHFSFFCSTSTGTSVLHQLADAAAFSDDARLQSFLICLLDSILARVLRSPSEFTVGFIHSQLIPFFGVGLKSNVKALLDFVIFVRPEVLFDLLWWTADQRQAKQARQVINWIVQGDQEKSKTHTAGRTTASGKLTSYISVAPASSSAAALTPAAAAQPFALVAPPATDAQLSDLFLPHFFGVFTKLHTLLTISFATPTTLTRTSAGTPATAASTPTLRVPHVYKVHAVHALAALIQLSKERLRGFIPKILASLQIFTTASFREMSTLDATAPSTATASTPRSLSCESPLSFHLLCLWTIFINTLISSNTIGEYLSTIVVTLVHALGKLIDSPPVKGEASDAESAPRADASDIIFTLADFNAYRSSLPSPRAPKQSDKPNLFITWISSLPEHLLEQALGQDSRTKEAAGAVSGRTMSQPITAHAFRSHCIAHISLILRDLLLKSRPGRDLTPWMKSIPPLPAYPGLQEVQDMLQRHFDADVEHRMEEMDKSTPTDVQHASSRHAVSSAAGGRREKEPKSSDAWTACAFQLHLDRILSTIAHESDHVRHFTLRHFRHLLRDATHRASWESYCADAIGGVFHARPTSTIGHSRFTEVISALMQRCADANMENKLLASECLGEIGAIDPAHLSGAITVKPPQFTNQHDSHQRTVQLAHYLVHHLLVRALRSATDPQSQDRALCAIQQVLKYCGIDRGVQELAERSQVIVADKVQMQSRSHVESELARIVEARRATDYLPHSALTAMQQRAQAYQALTLWTDFPADVRAIIAPCLTSAYLIQDQFLQPRAPSSTVPTPVLGYSKPAGAESNKKPAVGAGTASNTRKRKDMTAPEHANMDIDESKGKMARTSTADRKTKPPLPSSTAAAAAATSSSSSSPTLSPADDAAPALTPSTIRPLPSKPIYSRKMTMPQWLGQFTRYLIAYTALPMRVADHAAPGGPSVAPAANTTSAAVSETLLYQACIGVVQSDVSIALFLLPYLVDHALRYGTDLLIDFIRREIMTILHAHARGADGGGGAADRTGDALAQAASSTASAHSSAQMCIQAVFELLDTLQRWCVAERRKIEAERAQQNIPSAPVTSGSNSASGADAQRPMLPLHYGNGSSGVAAPAAAASAPSAAHPSTRHIDSYQQFIDSIPKKSLANAAFQCKSFTRALKYMESHLREEKERWRTANERRQAAAAAAAQTTGKRVRGTATSLAAAAASSAGAADAGVSDGGLITDGPGAGLQSADLDSFQHMYASLEEPDGMRGLALLRQKASVASQIKDLESVGRWSEALTYYDHCLQTDSTQMSHHVGMMDCFRNLGQWQVGLKHAQAVIAQTATTTLQTRQVAVCAVQNAWRMRDWTTVDLLLVGRHQPDPTHFEVRLAALLLALSKDDQPLYDLELRRARKAVLSPLAAASWESYERAYPYLLQLQMIAEVDQMRHAMQDAHRMSVPHRSTQMSAMLSGSPAMSIAAFSSSSLGLVGGISQVSGTSARESASHLRSAWSTRLHRTTQTFRIREQLLCLRRVLFAQFDLHLECGMGWLHLAHQARKASQFEVAQGALLHAAQMGIPNTFLERARLLRARGQLHDALLFLEKEAPPDTKDTKDTKTIAPQSASIVMSQGSIDASFRGVHTVSKPCLYATVCLLLGKWIQDTNAKESRDVITLYHQAIHFQPKWEKAHFLLGKYYDELLTAESNRSRVGTLHSKQQQQQQQEVDARGRPLPSSSKPRVAVSGASPDVMSKFLGAILKSYGQSLTLGHKYLFQSMPRILTLWFEYSETHWDGKLIPSAQVGGLASVTPKSSGGGPAAAAKSAAPSSLPEKFSQCHTWLCNLTKTLPAYQWLTAFPQIISRLTHKLPPVYDLIKDIIIKVFVDYPQQAVWLLAPVNKSIDAARSARAREILSAVRKTVPASTNSLLDRSLLLFDQLIKICNYLPKQKKMDSLQISTMFRDMHHMHHLPLIVPLQHQMTVGLPALASDATDAAAEGDQMDTAINGSMSYDNHYTHVSRSHRAFPSHQCTIAGFGNDIEVLKSKEKPKKLTILGSDGRTYAFLCKREIRGDMRKNSRMMEFNTVVNRLLQESGDSRSRHLSIRTFSVLPMTEECGLIEWVPNTTGFRHLVRRTHDEDGVQTCFVTIKKMYDECSDQDANSVANQIKLYERLCDMYRPVFHKWFLAQFQEPYAWFQARLNFARSSAVWSMVGYVVGLGDRHGENILIDESNGDCVHVDFDCLFGKGLTLEKPERVPFRLTPNMVDALGISGVDGLFSSSAEVVMQCMRSNEQTVMSVLHTFIYDPLVEWKSVAGGATGGGGGGGGAGGVTFHPNAVRILDEIELKLRGQVAKESLPLNVHGQVSQLIREATGAANLAQMYIGWMPWL